MSFPPPSDPSVVEPSFSRETQPPSSDAAPPPWTYLDLLRLVFFAIVSFVLAGALTFGVAEVARQLSGFEGALDEFVGRAAFAVGLQIVWWLLLFGLLYYRTTVQLRRPFLESFSWRPLDRPVGVYVFLGVGLAISVGLLSLVLPMPDERMPIEELFSDPFSVAVLAVFGVLLAPLVEELIFRGFLFSIFERSHGQVAAVVLTATIFSLLHLEQYGGHWQSLAVLFYVGCALGAIRAWSGRTSATTCVHATYNATLFAGLIAALSQQGFPA